MNEQELDQILESMRQEEAPESDVRAAAGRVWSTIAATDPCARYRAQFAEYRAETLSEARRMLLEDHLSRCPQCRRELNAAGESPAVIAMPARRFVIPKWTAGLAAAAAVAAVALYVGRNRLDIWMAPEGPRASVQSVNGSLYSLGASTLAAGTPIEEGHVIRTGAGARARITLTDGSIVELNERTELSVSAAWSGQTIHLDRGDIIVHAAKQRRGSLQVISRDSEVAVKGTIFTVSAGAAGSLVGVVEGSVAVRQPGTDVVLQPGERVATTSALGKVTVREAVAWSEEKEKLFSVLGELKAIEKQLTPAATRTQAKLLSILPDNIVLYAGIPNIGNTIVEAADRIEARARESQLMAEWWSSRDAGVMKELVARIRSLSPMLGDEIVFALIRQGDGIPLLAAEVKPGQQAALAAELSKLIPAGKDPAYRFHGDTLLFSKSQAALDTAVALAGRGAASPFGREIAARYSRGVTWLYAADPALFGQMKPGEKASVLGVNNVRYLFIEQRNVGGVEENEASLSFDGPRTGAASWLATPGSLGSAEYVSSDAVFALSAATRNPRQVFDEIYTRASALGVGFLKGVEELQVKTGVNAGNDLASSLGTDFTLAIETAAVPIPGWFAAVEVYQPNALNESARRMVEAYNRELGADSKQPRLILQQKSEDGRVWHTLGIGVENFGLSWTYDRGYLLIGMDKAVILRAIATRNGGFPLLRSEKFRAQLPTLAGLHQSGFFWVNTANASALVDMISTESRLREALTSTEPTLITFTGEKERIQTASRTRLTSFLLDAAVMGQMQDGPRKLPKQLVEVNR